MEVLKNYGVSGLVEWRAIELNRRFNFRHVVSVDEFDLRRGARLRERFGIKDGQSSQSVLAYRDKLIMKEIVGKAGLAVTPQRAVTSVGDIVDFIAEHGYPVVIKPRSGAASLRIIILRDAADAEKALARGLAWDQGDLDLNLMIEKYVEGVMYHVDGLVLDGKVLIGWPSQYFNDSLSYAEDLALGSSTLDPGDPLRRRLQDFIRQVVAALPTPRETTFHAEVFHTTDDRLLLCEIASRTGGGRINDTLAAAFGINITQSWVRAQIGLPVDVPPALAAGGDPVPVHGFGWLSVPPRANCYLRPRSDPPFDWVLNFRSFRRPDQLMGVPEHNADHIASFVIAGKDQAEVRQRLGEAQAWIYSQFVSVKDVAGSGGARAAKLR